MKPEDFRTFGGTAGCLGCQAIAQGRSGVQHSETCRLRIEGELAKTEMGKARLQKAAARKRGFEEMKAQDDERMFEEALREAEQSSAAAAGMPPRRASAWTVSPSRSCHASCS